PLAPPRVLRSFLPLPRPSRSSLFPYTTLFRSVPPRRAEEDGRPADREGGRAAQLRQARLDRDLFHRRAAVPRVPEPVSADQARRSEEHTSELQSLTNLVCRLLLEKKKQPRTHSGISMRLSLLRGPDLVSQHIPPRISEHTSCSRAGAHDRL